MNESATGLKLQMLHLAQDLGEVRRRHLSTQDLADQIFQDRQAKSSSKANLGNDFTKDVDEVKKTVGQDIQAAFKEMHSYMEELREESTQMKEDCDRLQEDDANMGGLLRRMARRLGEFEQNIGHF